MGRRASIALIGLWGFWASETLAAPEASLDTVKQELRDGHYAAAEHTARTLLSTAETRPSADSLEVASILDQLSIALRRGGKAAAPGSREVAERAVRIKESAGGGRDSSYAFSLQNLGAMLLSAGKSDEARPVLEHALEVRRAALGPDHLDVAASFTWLATLESRTGDYAAAESHLRQALAIRRRALPEGDLAIAECSNALAAVLVNMGDIAGALPLYEEALDTERRTLGPDHPAVAECHHNLGVTLAEAGNYEEAKEHLQEALRARRKTLGADHPLVASTLSALGSTLQSMGDLRGAQSKYLEALKMRELSPGPESAETAWTRMKLGLLQLQEGNLSRAKRSLEEARRVQELALGPEHCDLAGTLGGLARIASARGDSAVADQLFARVLEIQTRTYGPTSPDRGVTLGEYARFRASYGDSAGALPLALESARIRREHLRLTAQGFSERQALAYASVGSDGLDVALSLAAGGLGTGNDSCVARSWDALIRTRTLVLDEITARQRAVGARGDSSIAASAMACDLARQRLAHLLVREAGDESPERYQRRVKEARDEMERAERHLAQSSAAFRSDQERAEAGLTEVESSLPSRMGLVAYAGYRSLAKGRCYLAFVARSGAPPKAVPLGPAAKIDSAIARWTALTSRAPSGSKTEIDRAEDRCRSAGMAVRRLVWDPIVGQLAGLDRLLIVPDGALYRVTFAALPADPPTYLVETGPEVHYLSSERDLVSRAGSALGVGLLALGGPSFDADLSASNPAAASSSGQTRVAGAATSHARRGPGAETDCIRRLGRFMPLPESAREVAEISELWPRRDETLVLTGAAATERAVKQDASGRRVLHLATHGFFLGSACVMGGYAGRGIGGITGGAPPRIPAPTGSKVLQLSGLALAGANLRDSSAPGQDDGILTTEEIVSLDLSSLDWAVLSACDTGIGEIQSWEGVLGLRRSFQAAGARTIIMSLWGVEDRATRDWMKALYGARLRERRSTIESVRDADLSMLRDRRAQGRSTHPFYWAAFVATGDWN